MWDLCKFLLGFLLLMFIFTMMSPDREETLVAVGKEIKSIIVQVNEEN